MFLYSDGVNTERRTAAVRYVDDGPKSERASGEAWMLHAGASAAETLSAIGARVGAIVRADVGDCKVIATLLTGHGVPVLTLNVAVVGAEPEDAAVRWAVARICDGVPGFHLLRA